MRSAYQRRLRRVVAGVRNGLVSFCWLPCRRCNYCIVIILILAKAQCPAQLHEERNFVEAYPRLSPSSGNNNAILTQITTRQEKLIPDGSVGATIRQVDDVELLEIAPQCQWLHSMPARNDPVCFVSLHVIVSVGTIIQVGSARLGFVESPTGGSLQLMVDVPSRTGATWKTLPIHVKTERYRGSEMASMAPLTFRLDTRRGVWDLFHGSRLSAIGLPFISENGAFSAVKVRGGEKGTWLLGLFSSPQNPLVEDVNFNAIDDSIEAQVVGSLLSSGASSVERDTLAERLIRFQAKQPPPPLRVRKPKPDKP